MSVQGPLARAVADLRVSLAAMAQADARDGNWIPAPLEGAAPKRLFDPILRRFEGECEHLLVSPSSELFAVPFVSLARALGARVSFVPSLTSIVLLAERPEPGASASYKIGDASLTLTMAPLELDHLVGFQELQPRPECLRDAFPLARRVHFAGHGHFDPSSPYGSGIVLEGTAAPPLSLPSSFPGCILLTIPGIVASLDLPHCELAVISLRQKPESAQL
jgi:hypothetical protein